MLNRVLIKFNNEKEVEYLTKYAKLIKENHPNLEIVGLFAHQIITKENFNESASSDIVDILTKIDPLYIPNHEMIGQEYEKVLIAEEKNKDMIKEKFLSLMEGCEFYDITGETSKILLDELNFFDLVILAKSPTVSKDEKYLISRNHKPIILVPELENYSLEKVMMADDQEIEVNKALFDFIEKFSDITEITAVTVNIEEKNIKDINVYMEKTGKKVNYITETGSIEKIILDHAKNYDLLIMGDLKYSFMFEKIAKKPGLKLIEHSPIPVFIA